MPPNTPAGLPMLLGQPTRWSRSSCRLSAIRVESDIIPTAVNQGRIPFALARLYYRPRNIPPKLKTKRSVFDLRALNPERISLDVNSALYSSAKLLESDFVYESETSTRNPPLPASNISLLPDERYLSGFRLPSVQTPPPDPSPEKAELSDRLSLLPDERYLSGFRLPSVQTHPPGPSPEKARPSHRRPDSLPPKAPVAKAQVKPSAMRRPQPAGTHKERVTFSEDVSEVMSPSSLAIAADQKSDRLHTFKLKEAPAVQDYRRQYNQQLKESTKLAQARNRLQTEKARLSSSLQEAVSQRDIATERLQRLQKEHKAMEATLTGLWSLVKAGNREIANISTTTEIHNQVLKLVRSAVQVPIGRPRLRRTGDNESVALLERKLARSEAFLEHYTRVEALERQRAETATAENQRLRDQMDESEKTRQTLQARLDAAQARLGRVQRRNFFVYNK